MHSDSGIGCCNDGDRANSVDKNEIKLTGSACNSASVTIFSLPGLAIDVELSVRLVLMKVLWAVINTRSAVLWFVAAASQCGAEGITQPRAMMLCRPSTAETQNVLGPN